MKVTLLKTKGSYEDMRRTTLRTIGKSPKNNDVDKKWIGRLIRSEHSSIRNMSFELLLEDRTELSQGNLVSMECCINIQSLINISRKRLCKCASKEKTQLWQMILNEIGLEYPEITKSCVKDCVYKNGYCSEMFSCGYNHTINFKKELVEYLK